MRYFNSNFHQAVGSVGIKRLRFSSLKQHWEVNAFDVISCTWSGGRNVSMQIAYIYVIKYKIERCHRKWKCSAADDYADGSFTFILQSSRVWKSMVTNLVNFPQLLWAQLSNNSTYSTLSSVTIDKYSRLLYKHNTFKN